MTLAPIQSFPLVPALPETPLVKPIIPGGKNRSDAAIEAEVSPIAVLLSEEGLEFNRSTVSSSVEHLSFNLTFSNKQSEKLTAQGRFDRITRELDLQLQYTFHGVDKNSHPPVKKSFTVQLRISMTEVRSKAFSPFVKKEDILSMVRRVLGELQAVAGRGGATFTGATFKSEDLAALYNVDNGKLARALEELIHLIMLMARLKELIDSDNADVVLRPDYNEVSGAEVTEDREKISSLQISVQEIPGTPDPEPETNAEAQTATADELPGGAFLQPEGISPVPAALS